MKKYYWRCIKKETKESVEVCVLANTYKKAVDLIMQNKDYVPLEYLGWE